MVRSAGVVDITQPARSLLAIATMEFTPRFPGDAVLRVSRNG